MTASALEWLLAGLIAGLADYGLGLGFGLIASICLVALLGEDPRMVAASSSITQVVLSIPVLVAHRRAGNIEDNHLWRG